MISVSDLKGFVFSVVSISFFHFVLFLGFSSLIVNEVCCLSVVIVFSPLCFFFLRAFSSFFFSLSLLFSVFHFLSSFFLSRFSPVSL